MDLLTEYAESLGYKLIDCSVYGLRCQDDPKTELDGSWAIYIAGLGDKAVLQVSINDEVNIDRFCDTTEVATFEAGKLYIDSWHFKNLKFIK
jgi:hypothetical protein